jgi:hypothetical protein
MAASRRGSVRVLGNARQAGAKLAPPRGELRHLAVRFLHLSIAPPSGQSLVVRDRYYHNDLIMIR